jgi:hypothetical protein
MRRGSEEAQLRHLGVGKCVRCAAKKVWEAEARNFARSYGQWANTRKQSLHFIGADDAVISLCAFERCVRRRPMVMSCISLKSSLNLNLLRKCAPKRRNRFV